VRLQVLTSVMVLMGAPSLPPDYPVDGDYLPGPVPAEVVRVIDGDSLEVRATIWLGQSVQTVVRIADLDTPELRGACEREKELARAARDRLAAEAPPGSAVRLTDLKYDKYGGRILATTATWEGRNLANLMIEAGLGRAYHGGHRERAAWCLAVGS